MKEIDFTRPTWGHALHPGTVHSIDTRSYFQRLLNYKPKPVYSVMCHCRLCPQIGDSIRFNSKDGEGRAKILEVIPCGDPNDMFTLEIVVFSDI
jgi:hypothetical protein